MIRPTWAAGNNVPAIGTPDAKLFLEPQNNSTMESSLFNPSRGPSDQQTANTKANSPQLRIAITIKLTTDKQTHPASNLVSQP